MTTSASTKMIMLTPISLGGDQATIASVPPTPSMTGGGNRELFIHDSGDVAHAVAMLLGEVQPADNTITL
jgi:hypothetical protein